MGLQRDLKNKMVDPENAMKIAEINDMDFPPNVRKNILTGKFGFTVARGIHPHNVTRKKFNISKLCEKFRDYPHARQILKYKPVSVMYNGKLFYQRLLPEEIPPMPGFEKPIEIPIPITVVWEEDWR